MTTTADLACTCESCNALAAEYTTDPGLLRYYRSRLLVRGWAGRKSPVERAYILAHAPFAQAAARAGAANLTGRLFSRVDPAGTDGPNAELVAEGTDAVGPVPTGRVAS